MKAAHTAALLLLFVCCSLWATKAAEPYTPVTIPDANFRAFLVQNYPQVMIASQALLPCSAAVVTGIMYCSNLGMCDLTGIEHFDLSKEWYCGDNP